MKKIVLFVVFFVPFIVLAQNEAPKVSLSYDGKTTFLDQYVSSEGDTLSKIGMFAANIVSGEYFFGYNDFQVGVLGEFKNSQTLITRSEARSFNNLKFGIISRYNFNLGELKLGGGYFRDCQKNFGILGQDFFEYNTTKPGIFISGGVVLGLETRLLPRLEAIFSQKFGFTTESEAKYFEIQGTHVSLDLSLVKIVLPLAEIYISPMVGFEMNSNEELLNSIYKVGLEVSSNHNVRANIVKVGYFRNYNSFGIEGVYFSVNPIGIYQAFK